jgi:hypothetical protein
MALLLKTVRCDQLATTIFCAHTISLMLLRPYYIHAVHAQPTVDT